MLILKKNPWQLYCQDPTPHFYYLHRRLTAHMQTQSLLIFKEPSRVPNQQNSSMLFTCARTWYLFTFVLTMVTHPYLLPYEKANLHEEIYITTNKKIQPRQQSYMQAVIISATIGSLNALGCCMLERQLPLLWPINLLVARISCSLFLPSSIYFYLAFAERGGITCHCTTMQTSATIADWTTYLTIKNSNYSP